MFGWCCEVRFVILACFRAPRADMCSFQSVLAFVGESVTISEFPSVLPLGIHFHWVGTVVSIPENIVMSLGEIGSLNRVPPMSSASISLPRSLSSAQPARCMLDEILWCLVEEGVDSLV